MITLERNYQKEYISALIDLGLKFDNLRNITAFSITNTYIGSTGKIIVGYDMQQVNEMIENAKKEYEEARQRFEELKEEMKKEKKTEDYSSVNDADFIITSSNVFKDGVKC